MAALTISLIACSIHRIPGMVRTATKPRVDVGPAFFEHAPQHEAIVVRQTAGRDAGHRGGRPPRPPLPHR